MAPKAAAKQALNKLARRYGLSPEDLDELALFAGVGNEKVSRRIFIYSGAIERKLLLQIMYKVLGKRLGEKTVWKVKGRHPTTRKPCSTYEVDLTDREEEEIRRHFDSYAPEVKKAIAKAKAKVAKTTWDAFIGKNSIFPKEEDRLENKKSKNENKMSYAELMALLAAMEDMDEVSVPLPQNRRIA